MLSMSDVSVESAQRDFIELGLDVAFLVPTPTGYEKSIMDATQPLRVMLSTHNLHDYNHQLQGPDNKINLPAFIIEPDTLIETEASLYRPFTKNGDPRIWVYGLKRFCIPQNLLAIVTDNEYIFVLNMSDRRIVNSIRTHGYVFDILMEIVRRTNAVSIELLERLKLIYRSGFLPSVTRGDTGIGMTLENALGIRPNADKTPDYKGIEIKATRGNRLQPNRVNLFSQVPNWRDSKLKSGREILDNYGYYRDGRLQLYCTVQAHNPNSQGLYFELDESNDALFNVASRTGRRDEDVVLWDLSVLRARLTEKHPETFWVKARSRFNGGVEEFLYEKVIHTRSPSVVAFTQLIDSRVITMDYTLSLLGNRARDHGYLFKIHPDRLDLLFPPPLIYNLAE